MNQVVLDRLWTAPVDSEEPDLRAAGERGLVDRAPRLRRAPCSSQGIAPLSFRRGLSSPPERQRWNHRRSAPRAGSFGSPRDWNRSRIFGCHR